MKVNIPGEKIKKVLYSPHISEKSTRLTQDHNQYVFSVSKDSNKKQVQQAVEKHYEVTVEAVNLINFKGKAKGRGQNKGRRRNWKKAYVTLAEGSSIVSTTSE